MKIRELRKEKGLLQSDIAKFLSKTVTCICDWERGRTEPSIEDLNKLADFFDCSIDYLVGREDDFGNVVSSREIDLDSEDEKKLLSAFRLLDEYERESILIQVSALAREKNLIKK